MKKLKLPHSYVVVVPSDKAIPLNQDDSLVEDARQNKLRIIEAALAFDEAIGEVIRLFFFNTHGLPEPIRTSVAVAAVKFRDLVLKSDWCTFSAKRKLLRHIIDEQNLLEGEKKDRFEKLTSKIMSYRNACAHGSLEADQGKISLNYFEGQPKSLEFSEERLTVIESEISSAYRIAMDILVTQRSKIAGGESPASSSNALPPP